MSEETAPVAQVWGPTSVPRGEARQWRLGPLTLHVARLPWEWSVQWTREGRLLDDTLELAQPAPVDHSLGAGAVQERFAFGETADPLELAPSMGDRAFVATPDAPLSVLPQESARAYVSLPVWVQLRVGAGRQLIADVPVVRPQDTWFGSPTAGTLCYASRTTMRLRLDPFARLPHRALVTVDLRNRGRTPLVVSRLCIPAPSLPLLLDPDGQVRTPPVVFTRDQDELALIDVGSAPTDWQPLAPARDGGAPQRTATRVFNAFFSRSL